MFERIAGYPFPTLIASAKSVPILVIDEMHPQVSGIGLRTEFDSKAHSVSHELVGLRWFRGQTLREQIGHLALGVNGNAVEVDAAAGSTVW